MIGNIANQAIIRWEILPGLPGEEVIPKYFHVRHPTPWTEGLVVRFRRSNGSDWVGNFQGRRDRKAKIIVWREANSVVVITDGNLYIVDADNPANYVAGDPQLLVGHVMLDDKGRALFVAASTIILAFGCDRTLLWTSSGVGGYDAQFHTIANGVLILDVEEELGGKRKIVRLSATTGERM